jgi:glycosyltransferase involved in cell wall biosynthesis
MKILMVAIPNHHFFQWVNQLEHSGHEVYWFDITDGGPKVERINWVHQIKGWKLRFNYPFRHKIKKRLPHFYNVIQKHNERTAPDIFQQLLLDIKPDIIHCFEMQLSGLPIFKVMDKNPDVKLIYSSWGSDLYFYKELGLTKNQVNEFLIRVNYLITDCKRDYNIATENGFKNIFLGVLPGNGGISINKTHIQNINHRNVILIKGYEDGVGKALNVVKALELVPLSLIKNLEIVIYSADEIIRKQVEKSIFLSSLNVKILNRDEFIPNKEMLKLMGKSMIHVANSISDGMPNVLLESMGMGAFPIQSNPGKVAEEVMKDGINGYLIENPLDDASIAKLIENAINNIKLRTTAQDYNVAFIAENFNRKNLQKEIVQLYNEVFLNKMYNK